MPRMPYPTIGGDRLKNYHLLKILKKYFEIDLIVLADEKYSEESEVFIKQHSSSYKIFYFPKYRLYLNALKSFLNRKPLQSNFYYFKKLKRYVDSKIDSADLIISITQRMAEYVLDSNKPLLLDMADSKGLVYLYSYSKTSSLFWKLIYAIEYPLLLNYEKKLIEKFDATFLFNKKEVDYFNSPKVVWIPHGVNQDLLYYEKVDPKYSNFISFFGKMDYQPNIDAVKWFIQNVFPHLPESINFQIIGARPKPEVVDLQKISNRIVVRGYLDDPYVYLKSSFCCIAPMQTGGGIQNKILESLALGTIVLTTSHSAYPVVGTNSDVLLIADKAEDWVRIIRDIYENPQKYDYMKNKAREYIKNNFTWEIYEKKYIETIENIFRSRS
ncbi:MAG: glycosyltransferase family 4 protein [Ignavibacteria bacterium]|nr:glycosyltransferase family 4 protein [Ignavibacteria bacterium]